MARVGIAGLKYQFTGRDNLNNIGIAFLDSVTSARFAAGFSLDYVHDSKDGAYFESWDARLSVSTGFANTVFIGMTGRYLRAANDTGSGYEGPNGTPALPSSGSIQANGFTFDSGMVIKLAKILGLGVTGYNLTNTGSVYAPLKLGMGASVSIMDMLLIESDLLLDFTSYDKTGQELDLGTEFFLVNQFSLRLGYIHDFHFSINRITAGMGYTGRKFSVDLGYKQDIEYSGRFRLMIGFQFFIS
jgi:hypothetical protein